MLEQTESSGAGVCRRLPGGLPRPALVAWMGLDPVRGAGVADVADAFSDLRHAVHQALEVVRLEDEELRVADARTVALRTSPVRIAISPKKSPSRR